MISNTSQRTFYPISQPSGNTSTSGADKGTSSQPQLASSQATSEKTFDNPLLTKRLGQGMRQYVLKGIPWHSAYSDKKDGDAASRTQRIGAGRNNAVMGRHNTESPFYAKKGRHFLPVDVANQIMKNTSEVASIVEMDDFLKRHCAVEVVTTIEPHPQDANLCKLKFLTPKVEVTAGSATFTLGDLNRTPHLYQKYFSSNEERDSKQKVLSDVHQRLFEKGYIHTDAQNPANVVYNTNTGDFVLIDFETVKTIKEVLELDEIGHGTKQEMQRMLSHAISNGASVEALAGQFGVEERSINKLLV